jgi:hypothetical protein
MSGEKIATVLKGDANWTDWITEIEARARMAKIWEYMDPTHEIEPRQPLVWTMIKLPQQLMDDKELTDEDRKEIKKTYFVKYEKEYIRFTVLLKESLVRYIKEQVLELFSPYDILKKLASQFKPSTVMELKRIDKEIQDAFDKGANRSNTLMYLNKMTALFGRGTRYGSRHTEAAFITETRNTFRKKHQDLCGRFDDWYRLNKDTTYLKLIQEIREICIDSGMSMTDKDQDGDKALATLTSPEQSQDPQATPQSSNANNANKREPGLCECKETHWWAECKYLNWEGLGVAKPNDATMKQIQDKLNTRPGRQKAIQRSVERSNRIKKQRNTQHNEASQDMSEDMACVTILALIPAQHIYPPSEAKQALATGRWSGTAREAMAKVRHS